MSSEKITQLAIKRHDIDAAHFQNAYSTLDNKQLSKKETVFLAK